MRCTRIVLIVSALLLAVGATVRSAATPILGVDGARFTVNGAPRFLIFLSYFDGIRATRDGLAGNLASARLKGDLDYLAGKIDGIRVFPNWWDYGCPGTRAGDMLFGVDGAIRDDVWRDLSALLDEAAARGLIVDLSFSRESVGDPGRPQHRLAPDAFAGALTTLVGSTAYLKGRHPHVLVDVQNEWPIHSNKNEIEALLTSLRKADPDRILAASSSGDAYAAVGVALPRVVAAYHDPRHNDWHTAARIEAAIRSVRTALSGRVEPIYLQEPMPASAVCAGQDRDRAAAHFVEAARNAQSAGAAAWTFHTRLTFDLEKGSLTEKWNRPEHQDERQAVEAIGRIVR